MYSTCLHCHAPLGANDRIEHFPVGTKLAFDPAKGRLWVVCTKCHRWNLTPIEERWEAIEECERLYRGTRLRASTDNIGLTRLPGGLDLVRIGSPQLPEIASWRYVGEFRRRWLTTGLPLAAGAVAASSFQVTQMIAGFGVAAIAMGALALGGKLIKTGRGRARVADEKGRVTALSASQVDRLRLEPTNDGWGIRHAFVGAEILTGPTAVHTLRAVMTARNFRGAERREVDSAVSLLAEIGDSGQLVASLARASLETGIRDYPPDIACALEMALHQDVERRALEGELAALEDEWALAEEIAGIADNMFLPDAVAERHRTLKGPVQ